MRTKIDMGFTPEFTDNFLKANPDKCHLYINVDEKVTVKIKNETITNSFDQKLVRYNIQ